MALDFSRYDTRHYRTVPVREGYAAWSRFYDAQLDGSMDLFLLERIEGIDWSGVGSAVDLGCGTGRIGAWMTGRGVAAVDGVEFGVGNGVGHAPAYGRSAHRVVVGEHEQRGRLDAR